MSLFKRFFQNSQGSVTTICALSSIPFIAVAGLAVDYKRGSNTHVELQHVADAAALAAAAPPGVSRATRQEIARQYVSHNGDVIRSGKLTGSMITIGPNTVDVKLNAQVDATLTKIFKAKGPGGKGGAGDDKTDVSASAKAAFGKDSYMCLLALHKKAFEAVRFYGNSDFMAEVCTVHANSNNITAMRTMGSAYAEAEDFCAVGGWAGSGFEPNPTGGCNVKRDPYADLAMPPVGPCRTPHPGQIKDQVLTLPQGTYCGGLDIRGHSDVTLEPGGIYVIKDGTLSVGVHAKLQGNGVLIYMVGTSNLSIDSGASINLRASATGTWAGMAIMQAMDSNPGVTNIITSGGDINITGAYYTPNQHLRVWANGDMNTSSPYFPIVVDTFEMSGNATLYVKLDWEAAGLPEPTKLKAPSYVLLSQ